MIELRLLSRPGCHLCEEMRADVDRMLVDEAHRWEVVDVDSDDEIARRWGDSIPVLFVNGRFFAKVRVPEARGTAASAARRRRGRARTRSDRGVCLVALFAAAQGVLLEDLTWIEAEKVLRAETVVVIPLGAASKEHGPHLKLKNDLILARMT